MAWSFTDMEPASGCGAAALCAPSRSAAGTVAVPRGRATPTPARILGDRLAPGGETIADTGNHRVGAGRRMVRRCPAAVRRRPPRLPDGAFADGPAFGEVPLPGGRLGKARRECTCGGYGQPEAAAVAADGATSTLATSPPPARSHLRHRPVPRWTGAGGNPAQALVVTAAGWIGAPASTRPRRLGCPTGLAIGPQGGVCRRHRPCIMRIPRAGAAGGGRVVECRRRSGWINRGQAGSPPVRISCRATCRTSGQP